MFLAGTLMAVSGIFQALRGLIALFNNTLYVNTPKYIFEFNVTAWGWLHLIWGVVLVVVGVLVIRNRLIGRVMGIAIVTIAAVLSFMSLPLYPVLSLLLIVLNVFTIMALCTADGGD